ncbi:MAG: DUF4388 domain-containing protein [Candidatus Methylomirabilales bacterium]
MGLVGRVEDLALPDIFQILSLSKKTGKLTLTRREGTGVIVFKHGQIIYAASDSVRDTLGNILVCQKLITESTLMAALEAQHRSPDGKRLGTILVEMGYLTKETLEKIIRQQIEKVIYEFLTWKSGFFKFELMDVPDGDEVEVDAKDFLLRAGLNAEYLILEGLRKLDEQERERKSRGAREPGSRDAQAPPPPAPLPTKQTLSTLKAVLSEIRSPSFTGEITLMIMRYAAEIVNRGVLFVLRKDGIAGMGQFGIELKGASADERVRNIKVPLDQPSVLVEVVERRQTYRGKLEKTFWNDYLVEQLGGSVPGEVVAVPMLVSGTVVVIFYGDNLPKDQPIGEIDGLELLMIQAGLAMEKSLLEMKIKNFEQKLQEAGGLRPS